MVINVAYSTIFAFFLCWWLLGLRLQRMPKPRPRKRQELTYRMVLLSEDVAKEQLSTRSKCIETTKRSLLAFRRSEQKPDPPITSVRFSF
jgi:hypothetical protein